MTVRTRIAPSPTGYPHIGTIWQALVNFAYAKKNQGQFIVRIEDTDRERLVPQAEKKLFQALDWFGLVADESPVNQGDYGPYRQSERLDLYQQHAQQLIAKGQAYYCFCSQERLDQVRKKMVEEGKPPMYDRRCHQLDPQKAQARVDQGEEYVVRLKIPDQQTIVVSDLIRGEIKFDSTTVDDQILLKSDGFPTYHLAVVVDDHLMKITHMVRGEEWISSAPKIVLLYDYFAWQKPVFIHTPLLRNPDKTKLSKRQSHTAVSWYRQEGYLPQAILNFLALLGWSHPQEKTTFSLDEYIKYFDLKDLSPAGPIVDLQKLDYLNGAYIRKTADKQLLQLIKQHLKFKIEDKKILKVIPLIKERINKLTDVNDLVEFLAKDVDYDKRLLFDRGGNSQLIKKQLLEIEQKLKDIKDWNLEAITQAMRDVCNSRDYNRGQFFMTLRVAVTGRTVTPPLFESMEILGQEKTLKKISLALKKIKA